MTVTQAVENQRLIHSHQDPECFVDEYDLEDNDSDTTQVAHTIPYSKSTTYQQRAPSYGSSWSDPEEVLLPSRAPVSQNALTWMRWIVVISLQCMIVIMLLAWPESSVEVGESQAILRGKTVETGDDINGLYKTLSHTYTFLKPEAEKFVPNMSTSANRMEVRRNWDLLMPLGSGSVAIPDYRDHPLLGDPITDDPIRTGPLFEASWTHALHCLYYAVDSYHSLIVNGRTDNDNPTHATHCFEYLRNSILCNLDMTLEGSMSTSADKDKGQPHVCRNREEAIAWIEARRVDDLQDIVGP